MWHDKWGLPPTPHRQRKLEVLHHLRPLLKLRGNGIQQTPYVNTSNDSLQYILTYFFQDQLTKWLKFRETFLDKALQHDGLGDFLGYMSCSKCGKKDGTIKCKDCGDGCMLKCLDCTVHIHITDIHCTVLRSVCRQSHEANPPADCLLSSEMEQYFL